MLSTGCASQPTLRSNAGGDDARVLAALGSADFVALGEVHDNPAQHAMRAAWLSAIADRRRFALAIEQLDSDRQSDLDRSRTPSITPHALAQAAGFSFEGWHWPYYEPYLRLALERGLPLYAANLSARETAAIARAGHTAAPMPPGWGERQQSAVERDVRDGHCGLLPERAIRPMADAQRARDRRMADVLLQARRASGLPVVLLAGNGHTRRDVGVPFHLAAVAGAVKIVSIGLLERAESAGADDDPGRWDLTVRTVRAARDDPCVDLARRFGRR